MSGPIKLPITPVELGPEGQQVLDEAMTSIAQDPKSWGQNEWDCGTFACLAGHIQRNRGERTKTMYLWTSEGTKEESVVLTTENAALDHLGLTGWDADRFHDQVFMFVRAGQMYDGRTMSADDWMDPRPLDGTQEEAFDIFADRVEAVTGMNFSHQREIYRKHFQEAE